jgi:hypothetical protein
MFFTAAILNKGSVMNLKEFVDKHPLRILVATAVGASTATAKVVSYYGNQTYERTISEFTAKNSQLLNKLVSIERKIGDETKTYFDVSKLIIAKNEIKSIEKNYLNSRDGTFFYALPAGSNWTLQIVSESELINSKIKSLTTDRELDIFLKELNQKNIYLWKNDVFFKFKPKLKPQMKLKMPEMYLNFFPMISVQIINNNDLNSQVLSLKKQLNNEKTLELFDSKNNFGKYSNYTDTNTSEFQKSLNSDFEQTTVDPLRGEIVSSFLLSILAVSLSQKDIYAGIDVQMNSIQKKRNVLYLSFQTTYNDIEEGLPNGAKKLIVDREIFMVGGEDKLYLVTIEVPTIDGRSGAYSWVSEFLSSLRIPI